MRRSCPIALILVGLLCAAPLFAAAPTAPAALKFASVTQTQVGVVIPALAGGAVSYTLERAHDNGGTPGTWTTLETAVTPSTPYFDMSLGAGILYWYRLIAVEGSMSTNGTAAKVITLPATPPAPVIASVTSSSVTFTFPSILTIAGTASLNLQIAPAVGSSPGTFASVTNWTGTTTGAFTEPGRAGGTVYWYRLVAKDASGTSTGGNVETLTLPAVPKAPKFGTVTANAVPIVLPALETGQSTWTILKATGTATSFTTLASGLAAGTHSDTAVSAGTSYWYELVAVDTSGGATGPSGTVTTPGTVASGVPDLGPGADMNGYRPFPADNAWNTPINNAPVDPNSANLIASIGNTAPLHPDFGANYNGGPFGIPYVVVDDSTPFVPVDFTLYADQSDPGPYPIPVGAPIENGSDAHVLVVDVSNFLLYEMWEAAPDTGSDGWTAANGAIFNMTTGALRPAGWTSADAAGLPIFPGLVRYDEVVTQGAILHALRFTCETTRAGYVAPARHFASSNTSVNVPPMGMRVRLKASFDISGYPPDCQVILTALKTYGMFVADNGGNWFISGAPDARWNDNDMNLLKNLVGSDFEVVQMGPVTTSE